MPKISGFPELSPSEKLIEQFVTNTIERHYRLNGFTEFDVRSVEPINTLLSKGETSKEIYMLSRLQEVLEPAGENPPSSDQSVIPASPSVIPAKAGIPQAGNTFSSKQLGLHFDLTIPFARYIQEHFPELTFPVRRSTIGRVWRGERPQAGRFREFIQADIDIVGVDELPVYNDLEIVRTIADALVSSFRDASVRERGSEADAAIADCVTPVLSLRGSEADAAISGCVTPVKELTFKIKCNNRKLLQGAFTFFGITDFEQVLRALDKLGKAGPEIVITELEALGLTNVMVGVCFDLASVTADSGEELFEKLEHFDIDNELFDEGLEELQLLIDSNDKVIADLSIARGLDYYTGNVFETFIDGHESFGSIASGGRYDNLVSIKNSKCPGVGMSIGVSRLVSFLLEQQYFNVKSSSPVEVFAIGYSEDDREVLNEFVAKLRNEGTPAIVSPKLNQKIGKQIDLADKQGIPKVAVLQEDGTFKLKDLATKVETIIS
jgi:histidyl-tRNA synthetase